MKTIKIVAIVSVIITIIAFIININVTKNPQINQAQSTKISVNRQFAEINKKVIDLYLMQYPQRQQMINNLQHSTNQTFHSNIGRINNLIADPQVTNQEKEYLKLITSTAKKPSVSQTTTKKESLFSDIKFLSKFIFSVIFSFAALFIVLSNKYDTDIKKWAISALTLIAGVWIGSA